MQVLASHVLPVSIVGFLVNVLGLVFFYDVHAHGHSHGNHGVGHHAHAHAHSHAHSHSHSHSHAAVTSGASGDESDSGHSLDLESGELTSTVAAAASPPSLDKANRRRDVRKRWWQSGADCVLRLLHIPMQQVRSVCQGQDHECKYSLTTTGSGCSFRT